MAEYVGCLKKESCTNNPIKCRECWIMADMYNHYPCYSNEPKPPKVAYLCDRLACSDCSYPECKHTTDISHAVNFTIVSSDGETIEKYIEKERETTALNIVEKHVCFPVYDDYYERTSSGLLEEY